MIPSTRANLRHDARARARLAFVPAAAILLWLPACAPEATGGLEAPAADGASSTAADPYPGINPLAQDRAGWQQLLTDHAAIRRTVHHREEAGVAIVEAVTESSDPTVAAAIREHARAMQARMKVGGRVRVWDPVFREMFLHYRDISIDVAETPDGVRIVERSSNAEAISLMRSHAAGVSEFVREGHEAGGRETPRIPVDAPMPPDEVSIGGQPFRFLLVPPDAEQLAMLKSQGAGMILDFSEASERPGFNEGAAARQAGLGYCNLPYREPPELTDGTLDQAREALRNARAEKRVLVLHCADGSRTAPVWAAYRVLDQGVPLEVALGEARALRMQDPRFEIVIREYVGRRAPPPAAS